MRAFSYLAMLDALLAEGAGAFSPGFRRLQSDRVAAEQRPDGGFGGRIGGSDLYYTDFALRTLSLLDPSSPSLPGAARWLETLPATPGDVIECFCRLNAARSLESAGIACAVNREACARRLEGLRLPDGGYGRPGGHEVSAYYTFLAGLCDEMLEIERVDRSEAILALQRADDGFADAGTEAASQTNATAAALGWLTATGALDGGTAQRACAFLAAMQAADGGLLAHPEAPTSDLLSTFTGLWTLLALGEEGRLDLGRAGRYVAGLAQPKGGFVACPLDTETDVEYTYYGVAMLALLRAYVKAGTIRET